MFRALVISSLFVSVALGLSVVDKSVVDKCSRNRYDEVLKSYDGYFFGSSLGVPSYEEGSHRVSWETASMRIITEPYKHTADYELNQKQPSILFDYAYGLEPHVEMSNGFDTVQLAGCSVKSAIVSETKDTKLHATSVGGLRPIPGKLSHTLLGNKAPRVSFCFPQDPSMDGRLVWGAPDPTGDGSHTTLKVAGGIKAHHWAVNVTGMSMHGPKVSKTILDGLREKAANDPKAYWIAVFSTGHQTLVVPKEVLSEMEKYLEITTNLVDCAQASEMPSLTFELDGQAYTVSPKDYLAEVSTELDKKILQEVPLHFRPKFDTESSAAGHGKCAMMFGPPTPFDGVFVLGQPFLRLYETTYDFANRVITTAPHAGSCWSESGATRSHKVFTYVFSAISLAIALCSVF